MLLNQKPSLLFRVRKYLFGQTYSTKEKVALYMAFFMWGTGAGVAGPVIIENILGASMEGTPESAAQRLAFFFFFSLYIIIFYPLFYYVSKCIIELFLFVLRLTKR